MRVLYIGNKLSKYGFIPTTVETLGKQLEEIVNIVTVSDKKSQTSRLFDMVASVFRNRKVDYVIIDTYSSAGFYYAFFASLACRLFRIKYIPILHGGNLPYRLDASPKMSRMVFCHSYINVSPSNHIICQVYLLAWAICVAGGFPLFVLPTTGPSRRLCHSICLL